MNGFAFDTGDRAHTNVVSSAADDGHGIRFTNIAKAQSAFNKIKANIEACETVEQLDEYMSAEGLALDALYLFDRFVALELQDIYAAHMSYLSHGT